MTQYTETQVDMALGILSGRHTPLDRVDPRFNFEEVLKLYGGRERLINETGASKRPSDMKMLVYVERIVKDLLLGLATVSPVVPVGSQNDAREAAKTGHKHKWTLTHNETQIKAVCTLCGEHMFAGQIAAVLNGEKTDER